MRDGKRQTRFEEKKKRSDTERSSAWGITRETRRNDSHHKHHKIKTDSSDVESSAMDVATRQTNTERQRAQVKGIDRQTRDADINAQMKQETQA